MQPMIVACCSRRPAIRRGRNEGERSGLSRRSFFTLRWRSIASRARHVCCRIAAHVANAVIQLGDMTSNPDFTFAARCQNPRDAGLSRHWFLELR